MSHKEIYIETHPPIGEIVLNQPAKRNALSVAMWDAIPDLVARHVADTSVKVIIIHGGTAGAFAAGADISEFEKIYATAESAAASGASIEAALNAVEACAKPVIAAIDGACVGGGVSLAMAADLRVASAGSKFGVTPGKLGLVYPVGDTKRLLAAIGPSRTKDILLTGRIFPAEDAYQMGLIDRLADKGEGFSAARAFANEIAGISQWSTRATKQMIAGLQSGWTEKTPDARALFLEGFANEDFEEGYRAFLDKRKAEFTLK